VSAPGLLILGAGGHGKVAADCAAAQGRWSEIVFYDDRWPAIATCARWPVAGTSQALAKADAKAAEAFVAIGEARLRLEWIERLREFGFRLATIVHPSAIVSPGATIGAASLVVAGAIVNIDARIGEGAIVNTGASLDHDCVIGAGAHICPGARLAGDVSVGSRAWVGIGASVRQGIAIGEDATIGAGAAVVRDVADGATVCGVPARPMRAKEKG
jgi:sugar O-acyltransferase (sialic acid O-acetyltransferase NeuD family)